MKKIILLIILVFPIVIFSQSSNKETIAILFDETSNETSKVEIEGQGYLKLKKFRKETIGDFIYFKIGNQEFSTHRTKSPQEKISTSSLKKMQIVDLNYIQNKYNNSNEFKHHVFKKIYILEKISDTQIIKREVAWIDEMIIID